MVPKKRLKRPFEVGDHIRVRMQGARILDGEVACLDEHGVRQFNELMRLSGTRRSFALSIPCTIYKPITELEIFANFTLGPRIVETIRRLIESSNLESE